MANLNVPRPIFVITDVFEDSYVTSLEVFGTESNHDEVFIICGTNDGIITIWLLSTYRRLYRFDLKEYIPNKNLDVFKISSLIYLPSKNYLFVHQYSGYIYQFKICLNDLEKEKKSNGPSLIKHWKVNQMTFAKCFSLKDQSKNYIAFLNENVQIELVDIDTNKTIKINLPFEDNCGIIISFKIFFKNQSEIEKPGLYIVLAHDGFLRLFHLKYDLNDMFSMDNKNLIFDSSLKSSLQLHPEMLTNLYFNDEIIRGIASNVSHEIVIWKINFQTNEQDATMDETKRIQIQSEGITCGSIRPDGKIFAIGNKDGRIRVFATKSGKPLAIITYHCNPIETLQFTKNLSGNSDQKKYLLFVACKDKAVSIWSLYNDKT